MFSSDELAPYTQYIDMPYSLSRKTNRLQEFYRFLDFHCQYISKITLLTRSFRKSLLGGIEASFGAVRKTSKETFLSLVLVICETVC